MLDKWTKKMDSKEKAKLPNSLKELIDKMKERGDFVHYENNKANTPYTISYIHSLVDTEKLHRDVLRFLPQSFSTLEELKNIIPIEEIEVTDKVEKITNCLLQGFIVIQMKYGQSGQCALVKLIAVKGRGVSAPEIEFSVEGPKEAFVESIDTNLNLIRKRLPIPELTFIDFEVGKLSKTKIAVAYIDGKAEQEVVETVLTRIKKIEFEQILDSSYIQQMLADNSKSPFPQLKNTERPDRIAGQMADGKIVILVDGSPYALVGPTTLVDFFSSMEDYYLSWHIGTILRLIRYVAVAFSIFATPLYVAVLTFHYEMIPRDLLPTLIGSRSNIPFPPLLEALFLELTIELLREAGSRLPTKVGQTLGIVGGIVIGQASVEAALTSNVLLIIVALAALASFTTPVYRMSNTIRLLRFPFLIFAAIWGLLGIMICLAFFLTHLLRLTSLGLPYMNPIYPPRLNEWKDAFVRLPYNLLGDKEQSDKSRDPVNFNLFKKQVKDIDE